MNLTWTLITVALICGFVGFTIGIRLRQILERSKAFRPERSNGKADVPRVIDRSDLPTNSVDAPVISTEVMNAISQLAIEIEGASQKVLTCSAQAREAGLVIGDRVTVSELLQLATEARATGEKVEREFTVRLSPLGLGQSVLKARAAVVDHGDVLILVEDLTSLRTLESVRRDFVINVSHELKTPVGALGLLAEALLADVNDPDQVRNFAERIEFESRRLSHLIGDIIDLSRVQSEDPLEDAEVIEVSEIVNLALDAVVASAEAKDIEIESNVPPGLTVEGVKSQLVAALRNIVANALNYSPEHTRVAVVASREVSEGPEGATIEIAVKDQGVGIPSLELDRIFERFYRVDRARSRNTGGTGLGLAIVKHVCLNHGGDISVWSVEGQGSTFTMLLPERRQRVIVEQPPNLEELRSTG